MKTVYYSNGELNDADGTGITIASYNVDDKGNFSSSMRTKDGSIFFGYLPNEITKEEYEVWKERIANPDNKKYFAGIFAGIGVVDKATRKMLDAKITEAKQAHNEKQVEANRINFKLAQRDAEAIGEDHEAVFTSKHPTVSEDVKAILFAEARKAKG
jgi:hypothetical protein